MTKRPSEVALRWDSTPDISTRHERGFSRLERACCAFHAVFVCQPNTSRFRLARCAV